MKIAPPAGLRRRGDDRSGRRTGESRYSAPMPALLSLVPVTMRSRTTAVAAVTSVDSVGRVKRKERIGVVEVSRAKRGGV